jgi:hypothetical protein
MKIITIFFILLYSINTNGQFHKFENIKQILKSDDKNEIFKILNDEKYFLVDSTIEEDKIGVRKNYKFIADNKEDTIFKIWISEFESQKNELYLMCCFINIKIIDTNYKNDFEKELIVNDFKKLKYGDEHIIKKIHPKKGIIEEKTIWAGNRREYKYWEVFNYYYKDNQYAIIHRPKINAKINKLNYQQIDLIIQPKILFKLK